MGRMLLSIRSPDCIPVSTFLNVVRLPSALPDVAPPRDAPDARTRYSPGLSTLCGPSPLFESLVIAPPLRLTTLAVGWDERSTKVDEDHVIAGSADTLVEGLGVRVNVDGEVQERARVRVRDLLSIRIGEWTRGNVLRDEYSATENLDILFRGSSSLTPHPARIIKSVVPPMPFSPAMDASRTPAPIPVFLHIRNRRSTRKWV
ncbi:hypothetical protein R3P38DRAFT_3216156 [Favolaschia claudopus]|uniref:Uncharacterized protein n=1 Tax=Favolaschia claudopus TaxID=2862362 RepID=A0AAW0A7M4_9AGAR